MKGNEKQINDARFIVFTKVNVNKWHIMYS
jgi:hypothetical protein